jgi:hypothetical protein
MSARPARLAAAVALALLALTGCTSHTVRCSGGTCAVSLSGEQTVEIEIGTYERDLRVAPIEAGAVTLTVRGESARVTTGGTATVGGLAVQVDGVSGQDVELRVTRA